MTTPDVSRRHFLRGSFLSSLQTEQQKIQGFNGIRPPWSKDNQVFIQHCTCCDDCIEVCETHILIKGEGGFPQVQFSQGECTFCHKCVDVCKQPIFRSIDEKPWEHKVEITPQCLTQQKIECRSCQDNCPMNAIRFRLQIGGVAQPMVNVDNCNGCGACLNSCPVNAIKITYPNNDE
ncbi:ferredoxin-type protein NapF [Aggregatibacter segnis]|uniref:ferredoxin-type protein NapF n=1 Tax=Aggregatibacter segnis TaxID=739 RepID=UPI0028D71243|nr:ferredoxin-type protein NapF [Aggregatibacter segnis]